jgi:hypothetical protein
MDVASAQDLDRCLKLGREIKPTAPIINIPEVVVVRSTQRLALGPGSDVFAPSLFAPVSHAAAMVPDVLQVVVARESWGRGARVFREGWGRSLTDLAIQEHGAKYPYPRGLSTYGRASSPSHKTQLACKEGLCMELESSASFFARVKLRCMH